MISLHPELVRRFKESCAATLDISEHLGTLWGLSTQSNSVTEFGVRSGTSTTALLAGQPEKLTCYDIVPCGVIEELRPLRGRTELIFHRADSREVEIEETDFLFIDTIHAYSCLSIELRKHSSKVRNWIALHDTAAYGIVGDDGKEGMNKAIEELERLGRWKVFTYFPHNYGLTILGRV